MKIELSGIAHETISATPEYVQYLLLDQPSDPLSSYKLEEVYFGELQELYREHELLCHEQLSKVIGHSTAEIRLLLLRASGYSLDKVVLGPAVNLDGISTGGLALWVKSNVDGL